MNYGPAAKNRFKRYRSFLLSHASFLSLMSSLAYDARDAELDMWARAEESL